MSQDLSAIEKRVFLRGELIARTGLRVGADRAVDTAASDLPVMRDGRGLPYLPGSSFKGALRSAVEAMLRGAIDPDEWGMNEPPEKPWACDPLADVRNGAYQGGERDAGSPCLHKDWAKLLLGGNGAAEDRDLPVEVAWQHSCSICRLFGNNELGGRVLFADLPLVQQDDDTVPIEVRDSVAIERDSLTARDGGKYDYEVVPAGTRFKLEIVLDNPDPLSTGLLVAGIEAFKEGHARIGGFASRGLGRVDITVDSVGEKTAVDMLTGQKGAALDWARFREDALAELGRLIAGGDHA